MISPKGQLVRARLMEAAEASGGMIPYGFCAQLALELSVNSTTVTRAANALGLTIDQTAPPVILAPVLTRRCRNKLCIERFVPVNGQHWYHETACSRSELLWTVEEILSEEGSLSPDANPLQMAKIAFAQKSKLVRENATLRSNRDYLTYAVDSFYQDNPEYVIRDIPRYVPTKKSTKGEREILVQLSDWQIGKWENGFGIEATMKRVEVLKKAVRQIVERQREAGYTVNRVTLSWGGDMIEGCFIYSGQNVTGLDRTDKGHYLTTQIQKAAHEMAYFSADVATYVDEVINEVVGGNHGRVNGQNDVAPAGDNFDVMAGRWASDLTALNPRIQWNIHEEWWGGFYVSGHYVVSFHGDKWRGADLNPLRNLLPQWIVGGEFPEKPAMVLTHHRHSYAELDVSGIRVLQNGAIDGGSNWYTQAYGNWATPAQRILVMSERFSPEASWPVYFNGREN